MDQRVRARMGVLAAAILFSTGGAAVKAVGFNAWQVAGIRSLLAAATVLVLMPSARRRPSLRVLGVGVAYAVTLICYVAANKLTTAANTIFLQSTAPLYILLAAPWALGEKVRRRDLALMVALAGGLALFFAGVPAPAASAPRPLAGNVLGAAAGLGWAATILGLRLVAREEGGESSAPTAVVAGNLIAFAAAMPLAWPLPQPRLVDWLLIAYLGVFQVGVAYVFLTQGLRRVEAFEASLLLLLEPVLNPVWAWAVQGERPGALALAGGGLILLATAAKAFTDARFPRHRPQPPGRA